MRFSWATFAVAVLAALVVAGAANAQAEVDYTRGTLDFNGAELTCPKENVFFEGVSTYFIKSVRTPSGVNAATFLFNLNGVTAVGATSGTVYRVVGVTATGFSDLTLEQQRATTYRFVQTWLLVPVGGGEPLTFHEVDQVIWDANGTPVVFLFRLTECD